MLKELTPKIAKIMNKEKLTRDEVKDIFVTLSREDSDGFFNLAFSVALYTKGPTEEELLGLVDGFKEFSINLKPKIKPSQITDVSGTGGDKLKTFNISTTASFVVAGGGVPVAKQSFRALTSLAGSSDTLGELGIKFASDKNEMEKCLETVGFVPLFYPFLYKGMETRIKAASKVIDTGLKLPIAWYPVVFVPFPIEIKKRTYGMLNDRFLTTVANIFKKLKYKRVLVFHGVDGLDEISNIGSTKVAELNNKKIEEYEVKPEDFGLSKSKFEDIRAESKEKNIIDLLRIIYGKEKGPKRDIVLMNASGSFYTMGKVNDFKEGVELAKNVIDEGNASKILENLIEFNGDKKRFETWKKQI